MRRLKQAISPAVLRQEALSYALDVCEIVPARLGESIGDYTALAIARYQNR